MRNFPANIRKKIFSALGHFEILHRIVPFPDSSFPRCNFRPVQASEATKVTETRGKDKDGAREMGLLCSRT